MQNTPIPIYRPSLQGNEKKYLNECIDTGWISGGRFVKNFEQTFSEFTGAKEAIAVSNGSVALHLALHCVGVRPGDEVLVPTFTYIASVNAIVTAGAVPVFVDSRPDTWLMDVTDAAKRITPRTTAIMPVHLYGFACDMVEVQKLADAHGLKVVEDAAEGFGVRIDGQHVGTRSDAATFSFYGNKTITCGEGGMVTVKDPDMAEHMRVTRNQGMSPARRYWHDRLGFNYRMTNMQAAIGLAQIERANEIIGRKREIYQAYRQRLEGLPLNWQEAPSRSFESSYWLVSLLAPSSEARDRIYNALDDGKIEHRPVFIPAHEMPMYDAGSETFPVAEDLGQRGFSLPSFPDLQPDELDRVAAAVRRALT
ncbi:MAG: DegT/DnrJ/EryC1/StrS family aminotransferase [Filomicrobium sp.]